MDNAGIRTAALLRLLVNFARLALRQHLDAHFLGGVARILISAILAGDALALIDKIDGLRIGKDVGHPS